MEGKLAVPLSWRTTRPRFRCLVTLIIRDESADLLRLSSCVTVVDKEISEAKLSMNARARIVAESYLSTVRTLYSCLTSFRLYTDALCLLPSL